MDLLTRLKQGVTTPSPEETRAVAAELGAVLPPDTIIALHGDMGVGKTTFVQGLARGLGITEQVTSPTFAIYTLYRGSRTKLVHLDAYRIEHERQIDDLLLEEFLTSPWCLAVEWPEKTGAWLPEEAWHLTLSIVDGDTHHIVLGENPPPATARGARRQ
ncbi:MAG TPA: tRNA (adenosine(37)-N6)-threonylcarbamoyltransferase complex ATPase subunit type 1 TsaE [Lacunisphaera sp.]|nr:tRNA (adenosine(37)-N6)-threonylcarbamoyltransferase complex ATPase subunit type 1 TsaE [Lacunisphaera sp.]